MSPPTQSSPFDITMVRFLPPSPTMAATPEELLGQEDFLAVADREPFSPSVFIDLPPTPRPDGGPDGEDLASSDDLVLPFISRMLMEDIDDKFFYQYPDHPALLTAQEPFAKILSDATTTSSGSDSATTNSDGSGTFTLSPSSSDAPAFANATWPYDPAELSQLLQSTPYPDMGVELDVFTVGDANAFFLPAQDVASAGVQQRLAQLGNPGDATAFVAGYYDGSTGVQSSGFCGAEEDTKTRITTLPAGDKDHFALASAFFSGENGDMLNLAFLKGMEEAKKFLPTNNSLFIDLEDTYGEHLLRNSKLSRGFATGQVKKDGMPMFQVSGNGRGGKNQHSGDDLEAEAGRNSKVMVPEPEEADEMVDKMIIDGYAMCLDKMKGLCITMSSEAEKNVRKSGQGRWSTNEVDLHTLLINCAQTVATGDRRSAIELLRQIKQHSSPRGDGTQRMAHYFAEGLEARLAGTGSKMHKSLVTKRTSVMEFLKAYLAACCFKMTAYRFSNMTISKVIAGRKKVHIVDYGISYGFQWPRLLEFFATREGGPPEVRITGIDLPQPGFRPAARIEETGRRLSNCARQVGVPFKFHSIAAELDTVHVDDLNIDPDEVLIVNSIIQFGSLMDEGVDIYSPSPRDVVLGNIRRMRPDAFILCIMNGSYSTPFFVTRFREALLYYSAMFDMLDATSPRDSEQRLLLERDIIGRSVLNVIACEGSHRVERPETYKRWQVRNQRAGLRQLPLDPDIVMAVREKAKSSYPKDFTIDLDLRWLLEGWKGRILYAMSTWVADDAIS
ncbi:scarecrow-like protein 33 [Phragmites australis]|uniref:scarecrow-like protein 33 n=1 Tax=Phragmites australis TaxID=29695 RepID=UPI002D77FAD6|nr:scarecrow-like protein 33 [Phragmites australis]